MNVTCPMTSDARVSIDMKPGDIVWAFDVLSDMKIPLEVLRVYEDGSWDGGNVWTWGRA